MFGPLLLAQVGGQNVSAGWFLVGGALAVVGVGVVIVILARGNRRRTELEERLAARNEASALPQTALRTPPPTVVRRQGPTFVDLPVRASAKVKLSSREETPTEGRRSPLSSASEDRAQHSTFVDLPGGQRERDAVVDLTDESIDLTDEREDAKPKRDPWA